MTGGMKSSEFWAAQIISFLLLCNALFDLGIDITDEMSMHIIGIIESTYAVSRGVKKGLQGRQA